MPADEQAKWPSPRGHAISSDVTDKIPPVKKLEFDSPLDFDGRDTPPDTQGAEEIDKRLFKFYNVDTAVELIRIQSEHVERLQKKLSALTRSPVVTDKVALDAAKEFAKLLIKYRDRGDQIQLCDKHTITLYETLTRPSREAKLLEALKNLAKNVEDVAKDSFATCDGDFHTDFRREDPDGYFAWADAMQAIAEAEGE